MKEEQMPFSGKDLQKMIIPLFMEQLLVMLVGMADTLAVSYAGAAVYRSLGKTSVTMYLSVASNLITVLCFQKKNEVVYRGRWIFRWDGESGCGGGGVLF